MRALIATILLLLPACHAPTMTVRDVVTPQASPYTVSANAESLRDNYYAIAISIKNGSRDALALDPTMFELSGPPAIYLRLVRLSFGRSAFRMPARVPPDRDGNGQVFFQMQPGHDTPKNATLHVHLPDGDHQVVFDVD